MYSGVSSKSDHGSMMLFLSEKRCVVSMRIGEKYSALSDLTFPRMEEYARRCWADFHVISAKRIIPDARLWQLVCWEKFQIGDLLEVYSEVFFLDVDCWIARDCPNVFELAGGLVAEKLPVSSYFMKYARYCGLEKAAYEINSGVLLLRRSHRGVASKPEIFPPLHSFVLSEQHWWAINTQLQGLPVERLDGRFHRGKVDEPFWIFHAVNTKTDKLEQLKLASRR